MEIACVLVPEAALRAAADGRRLPPEDVWEDELRRLEGIGAAVESERAGEAFFAVDGLRGLYGGERAGVVAAAREAARTAGPDRGRADPLRRPRSPPRERGEVVSAAAAARVPRPAAGLDAASPGSASASARRGPGRDPEAARHRHPRRARRARPRPGRRPLRPAGPAAPCASPAARRRRCARAARTRSWRRRSSCRRGPPASRLDRALELLVDRLLAAPQRKGADRAGAAPRRPARRRRQLERRAGARPADRLGPGPAHGAGAAAGVAAGAGERAAAAGDRARPAGRRPDRALGPRPGARAAGGSATRCARCAPPRAAEALLKVLAGRPRLARPRAARRCSPPSPSHERGRAASTPRAGSRCGPAPTAPRSRSPGSAVEAVREEWLVEDRWWTLRARCAAATSSWSSPTAATRSSSARAAAAAGTGSAPDAVRCPPLRRAARPLGLLLPRRRLDPGRARRRAPRARLPRLRPHRPRRGLGVDGVRAACRGLGVRADHRRRADPRGRRPPDPPGREPGRLPQPLPPAHRRPLPHPRRPAAAGRAAVGSRWSRSRSTPRASSASPAAPATALLAGAWERGETRRRRPRWGGGCSPPSGASASGSSCSAPTGAATGPATAGSPTSPSGSACPASRPATSTATTPPAPASRTPSSPSALGTTLEASEPRRRGNSSSALASPAEMAARFAEHPEAVAETARLAERLRFDLTEELGYRYPGSEDPDADRELAEVCRARLERALRRRRPAGAEAEAQPGGGAGDDPRASASPGFFLLHRDLLELAREVAVRGARAGLGARRPAAGARARLQRQLDRLLPDRPLPHRPGRERPLLRPLPQRGGRPRCPTSTSTSRATSARS